MARYTVRLLNIKTIALGTTLFTFSKPKDFTYKPGQYIEISIKDPLYEDNNGNSRVFSLVSAPHEETLQVAMRTRASAFKKSLNACDIGSEVEIEGPFGAFILHPDTTKRSVFLVGGIGITPVISTIRDISYKKQERPITLFLSTKTIKDAPFLDEINQKKREGMLEFVHIVTSPLRNENPEKEGRIDKELLRMHLSDNETNIFYVVGPPGMVRAMNTLLEELSVPLENIHMEEFAGYERKEAIA